MRRILVMSLVAVLSACSGDEPRGGTGVPSSSGPTQPGATASGSRAASLPGSTQQPVATPDEPQPDPAKTEKDSGPRPTGVEGTVVVHPDCYQTQTPCDQPSYTLRDGKVDARNAQGQTVGSARTNSSGAYRILVPAGRYTLVVSGGTAPTWNEEPVTDCRSRQVVVVAGQLTRGDLECRY